MIYQGINKLIEGALHTAWKPVRGLYEGVRGTTSYVDNAGQTISMSPRQKLTQRLKNNLHQVATGERRDLKGNVTNRVNGKLEDDGIGNRLAGGLHFVGDLTLGSLGTAVGWTVGVGAKPLAMTAWWAGKKGMLGAGYLARDGMHAVGDTAMGAYDLTRAMAKNPVGQNVLLGAGAVGAGGIGILSANGTDFGLGRHLKEDALQFYQGNPIESVPGTIGQSQVQLDSMGVDGDFVFAMHNLR